MPAPTLILASRSPRRAQLLREAGYRFNAMPSPYVDPPDPQLHSLEDAKALAVDLATRKARALRRTLDRRNRVVILGADTICVSETGELLGTPTTADDAAGMLRGFVGNTHEVVTGCSLLLMNSDQPLTLADAAAVTWGPVEDDAIDAYVASGAWRGKAGGYNLSDRLDAGWPITVEAGDDPTTVVGLPMRKLRTTLSRIGIEPQESDQHSPLGAAG